MESAWIITFHGLVFLHTIHFQLLYRLDIILNSMLSSLHNQRTANVAYSDTLPPEQNSTFDALKLASVLQTEA